VFAVAMHRSGVHLIGAHRDWQLVWVPPTAANDTLDDRRNPAWPRTAGLELPFTYVQCGPAQGASSFLGQFVQSPQAVVSSAAGGDNEKQPQARSIGISKSKPTTLKSSGVGAGAGLDTAFFVMYYYRHIALVHLTQDDQPEPEPEPKPAANSAAVEEEDEQKHARRDTARLRSRICWEWSSFDTLQAAPSASSKASLPHRYRLPTRAFLPSRNARPPPLSLR
jgi:hypothetical protein